MLQLAQDPDADALLDRDPLALLIGMLLDQQFPMERAFAGPAGLARRLGVDRLDARALAEYDPEVLAAAFTGPPALHRYPAAMAGRVQALAALLVDRYDGDAAALWRDAPDGATLFRRLKALPGFGAQKAQIFVALLGKQRGVTPPGSGATSPTPPHFCAGSPPCPASARRRPRSSSRCWASSAG